MIILELKIQQLKLEKKKKRNLTRGDPEENESDRETMNLKSDQQELFNMNNMEKSD